MRRGHEHRRVDAVRGVADARVLPRHPRGGDRIAGRGPAVRVDAQPGADPLAERIAPRRRLGRQVRLEQVPHGDALGGEDPARRHVVEPDLGDVERVEAGAAALQQRDAEHREVEVVVLRDPVDVLGEARRTAGPVPRPAFGDLLRQALGREPACAPASCPSPPRSPGCRRGGCSRPACRARSPPRGRATRRRSAPRARRHRAARPGRRRRGSPRSPPARPAASGRGSASSSSSRSSASDRSSGATGSWEAPRPGAGAPPAANQRRSTSSTSLPSSRACRSSCPTRSSGWIQVTLRLKQAPRRP